MTWQSPIIAQTLALLTASIARPLALAVAAWLILRIFRVRHPVSRHAVWTAVLIGMLVLPVLSVLAPHWRLPLLPAPQSATVRTGAAVSSTATPFESFDFPQSAAAPNESAGELPARARPATQTLIVWFYFAGLLVMASYHLIGSALLWRVVSRSHSLRTTRMRESGDILAPVAIGILRPSVILPLDWRTWNAGTRRAVLAHEFAHLRRGDTLVSALARFAKCLFWFHPLVWWISRQISELAELSCDAAVIEKIDDPARYSRMLLAFADTVHRAGYRAFLPGLAIASRSGMSKRIDRIFEVAGGNMRKLSRPGIVLAIMGVPVVCLAATVGLTTAKIISSSTKSQPASVAAAPVEMAQAQPVPKETPAPLPAPKTPPTPKPKFDVVSVKPCGPDSVVMGRSGVGKAGDPSASGEGGYFQTSPGLLRISCGSIMTMLQIAYVVNGDKLENDSTMPMAGVQRVRGVPGWAMSTRYTIEAKTNDPVANGETSGPRSPGGKLMSGPMLQSLLEDRFQLKIRREIEEVPMYNLVVAKGGFKLKPMQEGDCQKPETGPNGQGTNEKRRQPGDKPYCNWMGWETHGPNRVLLGGGVPISGLADFLSNFAMDRHVIDKTGLTTIVNFHLEYAPDDSTPCSGPPDLCDVDPNSDIPAGPSIFTALEQQLGLKLEPAKGPHGYIMVDHVEPPSEN